MKLQVTVVWQYLQIGDEMNGTADDINENVAIYYDRLMRLRMNR